MIGLDIAKSVFQLHGIDASGEVQLKRKLRRSELIPFFEGQPRCTVVMEACGAAHHWARVLGGLGHEVRLIAPEAVRPFVKRGKKNDAADAAAICAAASRPDARFVPVKSLGQQGVLALHSARALLVKQQTMLANAMRGLATEFGLVVPRGIAATVGGNIGAFRSARHFAAWLGLVPRQHSTGGKTRLGRITKAGDREIRTLLVLGATSMVHRAAQWNSAAGAWVRGLLERRPVRLVTVALANKMARIAWALMARNEVYRATGRAAAASAASA
jgi:transposase